MGLRELKAERTRAALESAATELFLAQGYDDTTMEQIAERAEVGASTLYRYFPTKDLLLLDWLVQSIDLGAKLKRRPADEPLPVALRAAILEALNSPSPTGSHARDKKLRKLIDTNPGPRARLWDFVMQARDGLTEEIGNRLGLPADHPKVVVTARLANLVHEEVGEHMWDGDGTESIEDVLDAFLRGVHDVDPVLPAVVASAKTARAAG